MLTKYLGTYGPVKLKRKINDHPDQLADISLKYI